MNANPMGDSNEQATKRRLQIGSRVTDKDGYIATVRYVGPVETSKSQDTIFAGLLRGVVFASFASIRAFCILSESVLDLLMLRSSYYSHGTHAGVPHHAGV